MTRLFDRIAILSPLDPSANEQSFAKSTLATSNILLIVSPLRMTVTDNLLFFLAFTEREPHQLFKL